MKKQIIRILLPAVFFVILFINLPASPGDIVGSWRATNACEFLFIQFNSDETFTADRNADNMQSSISGTYSVTGNHITLTINSTSTINTTTEELQQYRVEDRILTFQSNMGECVMEKVRFGPRDK